MFSGVAETKKNILEEPQGSSEPVNRIKGHFDQIERKDIIDKGSTWAGFAQTLQSSIQKDRHRVYIFSQNERSEKIDSRLEELQGIVDIDPDEIPIDPRSEKLLRRFFNFLPNIPCQSIVTGGGILSAQWISKGVNILGMNFLVNGNIEFFGNGTFSSGKKWKLSPATYPIEEIYKHVYPCFVDMGLVEKPANQEPNSSPINSTEMYSIFNMKDFNRAWE